MLPKNGFSGTTMPGKNSAVIASRFERDDLLAGTALSQFSGRKPAQPL